MIFGEAESESPRVPSPWTMGARRTSSARSSGSPVNGAAASHSIRKASLNTSPNFSPLSRAVRVRSAEAHSSDAHRSGTPLEDGQDDSLTSTPPTEEDEMEGFFMLDTDLDVLHLGSSSQSLASVTERKPGGGYGEQHTDGNDIPQQQQQQQQTDQPARRPARLAPEPDVAGNLEYKLRILPPTRHRYDKLLTQLKWRLLQGGGECTYEIGVLDDGLCVGICPLEMRASLAVLASMATELGATVHVGKAFRLVHRDGDPSSVALDQRAGHAELQKVTNGQARHILLATLDHARSACACGLTVQSVHETVAYIPQPLSDFNLSHDKGLPSTEPLAGGEIVIDIEDGSDEGHLPYLPDDVDSEYQSSEDASSEHEQDADEDGHGFTFSLSLDEKATRSGLGYQRRVERRRCRYNAQNAAAQRRRIAAAARAASLDHSGKRLAEAPMTPARPTSALLRQAVSSAHVETGTLVPSAEHQVSVDSDVHDRACVRLIVEATVLRKLGQDAYIDYASL